MIVIKRHSKYSDLQKATCADFVKFMRAKYHRIINTKKHATIKKNIAVESPNLLMQIQYIKLY
jgi:hypothetical protein